VKYAKRLSIGVAFSAALAAGVGYAEYQPETLYRLGLPHAPAPAASGSAVVLDAPPAPVPPAATGGPAPAGAAAVPAATRRPAARTVPGSAPRGVTAPAVRRSADASETAPSTTRRPPSAGPTPKPVPTASVLLALVPVPGADAQVAQVLAMVNTERATAGCQPLTADPRLALAAQKHSDDMAAHGYFADDSQDGRTPWDRIAAEGYPAGSAENIAKGQPDPEAVMAAWLGSPGHHDNVVDCGATAIGVGLAQDATGARVWTQDFGAA